VVHITYTSQELWEYFFSTFQTNLVSPVMHVASRPIHESIQYHSNCTLWVRRSTGRVCADLVSGNFMLKVLPSHERPTLDQWQRLFSLNVPHMEAMVIDSLTLEQFHAICCWDRSQSLPVIMDERTVHLGAILVEPGSNWDYLDEVVSSSNIRINSSRWTFLEWRTPRARGEVTEDGWTRYSCFIWPAWRSA
jgi:hypothetical protein